MKDLTAKMRALLGEGHRTSGKPRRPDRPIPQKAPQMGGAKKCPPGEKMIFGKCRKTKTPGI